MTDSQSPHNLKAQSHFLTEVMSSILLLGVHVEIPPLRGDAPQGYTSRLSERYLATVTGSGNINLS